MDMGGPVVANEPGARLTSGVARRVRLRLAPVLSGDGPTPGLLGGGAASLVVNASAVGTTFLVALMLSRLLGSAGYGAYVFALSWATLLTIPVGFGHSHLVVRSVAGYGSTGRWGLVRGLIRRLHQAILTGSLVVVVIALAVGWTVLAGRDAEVRQAWVLALPLVPICILLGLRESVMVGLQRVGLARTPETIIQPLVLLGLLIVGQLVFGTLSAPAAVVCALAAAGVALALSTMFMRRILPEEARLAPVEYDTAAWFRSARSLVAANALNVLNLQLGVILLGVFRGVGTSAVFSNALRASMVVSFMQYVVTFPVAPTVARLHASGDRERLQAVVRVAARVVVVIAAGVTLVWVALGSQALALFGPEFTSGYAALVVLSLGELVNTGTGLVTVVLVMTGGEATVARVGAVATVLNLVLSVLLIPSLGVTGVAIGRAVSLAGQNLALMWFLHRRSGIWTCPIGRVPGAARREPSTGNQDTTSR